MKDTTGLAPHTGIINQSSLQVRLLGGRGDDKGNLTPKSPLVGFDHITLKS